jgi:S1 RNA binding domain protein
MAVCVGAILEGVVTGITNFGAFVELPGGVTGLVHISEVADTYVKDVKDYLKEKDKIKVKVINIDAKGKIGLSIKQACVTADTVSKSNGDFARDRARGPKFNSVGRPGPSRTGESFEDKLAKFLKESDEKQLEFRRSTDAKRGGRGSSRY